MGRRARSATAACVLAAGLLVTGAGSAVAFADTPAAAGDTASTGGTHSTAGDSAGESVDASGRAVDEKGRAKSRRAGAAPTGAQSGTVGDDDPVKLPQAGDDQASDDPGDAAPAGDREDEKPWPSCCEGGKDECEPGWPWEWPVVPDPNSAPVSDGEYGENRPETLPPTRPMPPIGGPASSGVLDTLPGIGAGQATQAPIAVPIIVTSPVGLGPITAAPRVGGGPSGGTGPGMPAAPRQAPKSPPASVASQPSPRELLPATAGSGTATPASFSRIGYAEHLRSAGLPQLAALALPGLAGIIVLTGAGGLLGYRQARAGQGVHPTGIVRFMNEK